MKISHPSDIYENKDSNIKYGTYALEDLPLYEIRKVDPVFEKKLRNDVLIIQRMERENISVLVAVKQVYLEFIFK